MCNINQTVDRSLSILIKPWYYLYPIKDRLNTDEDSFL